MMIKIKEYKQDFAIKNPKAVVCPHCNSENIILTLMGNRLISQIPVENNEEPFYCVDCGENLTEYL